MTPDQLLVDPADVARRVGFSGTPTADQRDAIVDRIVDAQDDAEAFLGRPLFATPVTLEGVQPMYGRDPATARAWPVSHIDDTVRVVARRARPDGLFDVDLLVGLDGPNERALVRFVTSHAVESLRNTPVGGVGQRVVTGMSREGQSISYAAAQTAPGTVGGPVTTASIRGLRRHSLYKPNRPVQPPWPLSAVPVGYEP